LARDVMERLLADWPGSDGDEIPGVNGPLIGIAVMALLVVFSLVGTVSDALTGVGDVGTGVVAVAFFGVGFAIARLSYSRTVQARAEWREKRFRRWLLADELPQPESIDWASFEDDVEAALRERGEPHAPAGFVAHPERPGR
jgi:hypothetical protein